LKSTIKNTIAKARFPQTGLREPPTHQAHRCAGRCEPRCVASRRARRPVAL